MSRLGLADELHEHVAALRRYALVLTRNADEAEDLVQDCLTRAIAAAHSWQPGSDLRLWLFRIMHNAHISNLRKQRVRREARLEVPEPVVGADQVTRVECRQVLEALDQLPETQRQPILLVALEELSYADAARTIDVPLGTFMSRLARGREALRRILAGAKGPKLRLVV